MNRFSVDSIGNFNDHVLMNRLALISVSDKSGIVELSRFFVSQKIDIIATGGTFKTLDDAGIPVIEVSVYTGADEILEGRVKTLNPVIHAGLLAQRDNKEHMRTLAERDIRPIDFVVVNLYPFVEKAKEKLSVDELTSFIDIGGPTMLRAAAKNHESVSVISDPADYDQFVSIWTENSGDIPLETKRNWAAKVFSLTASYDAAISQALGEEDWPQMMSLSYKKAAELRYGENPHQNAAWYVPSSISDYGALSDYIQHQGKQCSFNNLRDLDNAWHIVSEFDNPVCAGVKHASPCGVATGTGSLDAWIKVRDADPISIFGGIVAFNCQVDKPTAESLTELFLEVIAAPSFSQEALEILKTKKNLRVLTLMRASSDSREGMPVDGGICFQSVDKHITSPKDWTIPTDSKPDERLLDELLFAWKVVKHVKSNAILLAHNGVTVGIGSGQPSRIGAVKLAIEHAGQKSIGAVMASDAFFPFDDWVALASEAGIKAVIQPGGSIRDGQSIETCNKIGISMIMTGIRHFRH